MKKSKRKTRPSRAKTTILRQIVELIPAYLAPKLARECAIDLQVRAFSAWSHVVAMLYAQLDRALGLNDVCDSLALHVSELFAMRRATAPKRNTLSHANKTRDCAMAEKLFRAMLAHLQNQWPAFARGSNPGNLRRLRRAIHIVDATTVQLVLNCINWAKHRTRKAAAKIHTRITLHNFLPAFVIVGSAGEHDNVRAPELCAALKAGEIVLFDKACAHFKHLFALATRGVFFVTREKTNLKTKRVKKLPRNKDKRILGDELIRLTGKDTAKDYPQTLRRVRALVEIDGQERETVFLTNNLEWSAVTICELYRARWLPSEATSANRGLLQATQANRATDGLHGQQRQRAEMANLDGALDASVDEVSGVAKQLAAQLHAVVQQHTGGAVVEDRTV